MDASFCDDGACMLDMVAWRCLDCQSRGVSGVWPAADERTQLSRRQLLSRSDQVVYAQRSRSRE